MPRRISWTRQTEDGVKRETRVRVEAGAIKWQFKRADEDKWDYDSPPTNDDWDTLEEILTRRSGRGRQMALLDRVRKHRKDA
jgi:hypothetical protein